MELGLLVHVAQYLTIEYLTTDYCENI